MCASCWQPDQSAKKKDSMPFSLTNREGKQTLTLEGGVTVGEARQLTAMLGEKLQAGAPLEVEIARLEKVDTCILQLLCSLKKTAPALVFIDACEVFESALDRSQLRRTLLGTRD
jgi:ABC-type transporter Mla MlaB component